MKSNQSPIDYADLEINLQGIPRDLIEKWLADFEKENRSARPELKQEVLFINSDDFITFLGYVQIDKISEMELQRLKTRAKQELERLLFNSTIVEHQYHYKWCLAALQNFEIGRKRKQEGIDTSKIENKNGIVMNFPRQDQ